MTFLAIRATDPLDEFTALSPNSVAGFLGEVRPWAGEEKEREKEGEWKGKGRDREAGYLVQKNPLKDLASC